MRIVPDRRKTIDHRKLAQALLHLAQAEYDAQHPESTPQPQPDNHSQAAGDAGPNPWE